MIKIRQPLLALLLLALLSAPCAAQHEARHEETATSDDPEAHEWFEQSAKYQDPDLLVKLMWYTGPSPRTYQVLELFNTGMAYGRQVLVNWSTRGVEAGVLSAAQVSEIRKILEEIKPYENPSSTGDGPRHLTLVYLTNGQYTRLDFAGPVIPPNLEKIMKKIEAGMTSSPLWSNRRAVPRLIDPCNGFTTENLYLGGMPQQELITYAGRRSLLPQNRYIALKCYFQRFPNDEESYVKTLRSWVERYEKGRN